MFKFSCWPLLHVDNIRSRCKCDGQIVMQCEWSGLPNLRSKLDYTMLIICYDKLYRIIPYHTIPYAMLYYTMPYYTILHSITLYYLLQWWGWQSYLSWEPWRRNNITSATDTCTGMHLDSPDFSYSCRRRSRCKVTTSSAYEGVWWFPTPRDTHCDRYILWLQKVPDTRIILYGTWAWLQKYLRSNHQVGYQNHIN